jgi:hypothetical protein
VSVGQQRPDELPENVNRQRDKSGADEFERQALMTSFEALKLPDHDDRRENLNGAIKTEAGTRTPNSSARGTGGHAGTGVPRLSSMRRR